MCGIFGYIGERNALEACVAGLERLEYRGYDSAGIAAVAKKGLISQKQKGKVSELKQNLMLSPHDIALAIGHTRWATHGKISDENAHPHFDAGQTLAIIHNGIIENFDLLKQGLLARGALFQSETDTEVIALLIGEKYRGNLLEAVQQALVELKGSFAIAVIHKDHPDEIIAAAEEAPLSIAVNLAKTEVILSSDPNAFLSSSMEVIFLAKGEIARLRKEGVEVFDLSLKPIVKKREKLEGEAKAPTKEGFPHFLLKEIYEQPATVQKAFLGRCEGADVLFEGLSISAEEMRSFKQVWILGCGTSAHAGTLAAMLLESLAGIPAQCDIASEGRFRTLLMRPDTLVLAISQSGETADTLSAIRETQKHGCKVLSFCNVKNSTLTREANASIFLKAGTEMSVCSTKAFTSQLTVLFLFALYMGRLRGLSEKVSSALIRELKEIPSKIEEILADYPRFEALGKKYSRYSDFFFMGRRYMFPTCLEAALKLKEISYANANGYPAGELKHGPLALLDREFPVIAFCANEETREKTISNLMEVKARGAPLLAFAPKGWDEVSRIADDTFFLPSVSDPLSPLLSTVAGQLFAYIVAKEKGCDIDQPRNLAKSVTVE